MAKSGSKKNPLVLCVNDDARADTIAELCEENCWHYIVYVDPDLEENINDLEHKLNPQIQRTTWRVGRNEPCPCGSGKKFKKCCASAFEVACE